MEIGEKEHLTTIYCKDSHRKHTERKTKRWKTKTRREDGWMNAYWELRVAAEEGRVTWQPVSASDIMRRLHGGKTTTARVRVSRGKTRLRRVKSRLATSWRPVPRDPEGSQGGIN